MEVNGWKVACVALVILIFAIPILAFFTISAPADAEYNRKFTSRVTMAYDQATFEGMEEQIKILWKNMNEAFPGDLNTTYSTWWYPDQTYENSLGAQRDYFIHLLERIEEYKQMYQRLLTNASTMLEDWYYKAIQNMRNEMQREGGLDWALRDAWYLHKAPMAYWLLWWLIPLEAVFIILAIFSGAIGRDW